MFSGWGEGGVGLPKGEQGKNVNMNIFLKNELF